VDVDALENVGKAAARLRSKHCSTAAARGIDSASLHVAPHRLSTFIHHVSPRAPNILAAALARKPRQQHDDTCACEYAPLAARSGLEARESGKLGASTMCQWRMLSLLADMASSVALMLDTCNGTRDMTHKHNKHNKHHQQPQPPQPQHQHQHQHRQPLRCRLPHSCPMHHSRCCTPRKQKRGKRGIRRRV